MLENLILKRCALGLLTLWIVSVVIFVATSVLPGDVARAVLGQGATEETLQAFRNALHLERPAIERYFVWLWGLLHGDLGQSLASQRPIAGLLSVRLENTIWLASISAIVAVPLSVLLGIVAAMKPNSVLGRAMNVVALFSISFPEFLTAYLLVYVLSVKLGFFPAIARLTDASFGEMLYTLALPITTLTIATFAPMMRMTRTAVLNIMSASYIETAILKGAHRARIILRHALPNAIGPIVTVIGFNVAYLIVGVIVVEVVFAYPGMGQLMIDAVATRDIPVVQACAMIFASTYVILNLLTDVIAIIANPRLRLPR